MGRLLRLLLVWLTCGRAARLSRVRLGLGLLLGRRGLLRTTTGLRGLLLLLLLYERAAGSRRLASF